MAPIIIKDTPEARQALKTARFLALTKYNQKANCKACDPKEVQLYKDTSDFFHAILIEAEEKL